MEGTGRCTCQEGYVGLCNEWGIESYVVCDTLQENDRCVPRCVQGKGACDEGICVYKEYWIEYAVCVCFDANTGPDCDYSASENFSLYLILGLVVVASFISFIFM